jgi:aquaporin Z
MKAYIVEALGTFVLASAAMMTGNPAIIGLALMVALYVGAHISGGHFNPAVTLSMWLRKASTQVYALGYIGAQLVGAVAAGIFSSHFGRLQPLPLIEAPHFWKAATIEFFGAFILCLVILAVTSGKSKLQDLFGLVIGLTLTMVVAVGIHLSGAVYNPAIASGLAVLTTMKSEMPSLYNVLTYVVSPLVGGTAASYLHGYLND